MDETTPLNAWQSPIVQQAFDESLCSRVQRIWSEEQRIFDTFDLLPQVFCHNDFHRRNLMIRANAVGLEELVVLDWAFCGAGPIGADIAELVGGSTYYFEIEPTQLPDFEETVLDGYMAPSTRIRMGRRYAPGAPGILVGNRFVVWSHAPRMGRRHS
jgi:aminoglycoside/choline kinase family phosphotransferase